VFVENLKETLNLGK